MSVKIVGKCEKCGADIRLDEDQERGYCEYCGAEFIVTNDNSSFAHEAFSYLNKAGKRLQEDRIRKEEVQEKNRKNGILYFALMFGVCMLFVILIIVLKAMGIE